MRVCPLFSAPSRVTKRHPPTPPDSGRDAPVTTQVTTQPPHDAELVVGTGRGSQAVTPFARILRAGEKCRELVVVVSRCPLRAGLSNACLRRIEFRSLKSGTDFTTW
jgi:hypothetical protein